MKLDGLRVNGHFHCSEGLAFVTGYVEDIILFISEHKLQRKCGRGARRSGRGSYTGWSSSQ